jgi:endonuclease III
MKNATKYQNAIKKLLAKGSPPPLDEPCDPVRLMIRAVLETDASRKQAEKAVAAIEKEYVDYNELRVAPVREVAELIGKDFFFARRQAEELTNALNSLFRRSATLNFDHVKNMTKRDLRRHLSELGLGPYAVSLLLLRCFGGHAIPVDESLVESLKMEEYVHPEADLADVQGFLERVVLQKDALSVHEGLRVFFEKHEKTLIKRRKDEARVAPPAPPVAPPPPPPGMAMALPPIAAGVEVDEVEAPALPELAVEDEEEAREVEIEKKPTRVPTKGEAAARPAPKAPAKPQGAASRRAAKKRK